MLEKEQFKLLDVGCGKGDLLRFIKSHNSEVELWGIDIGSNYHSGIKFIRGDFLEEEINMKFDAICSLAAIEHVADVNTFIKKVERLLLPGGLLIIMTVNTSGILYGVAELFKSVGISKPFYRLYDLHHINHFTGRSLKKLIERNDFDIIVQKKHHYPVRAVDIPKVNLITKMIYKLGVRILFSLPGRFGILQTVICKKKLPFISKLK